MTYVRYSTIACPTTVPSCPVLADVGLPESPTTYVRESFGVHPGPTVNRHERGHDGQDGHGRATSLPSIRGKTPNRVHPWQVVRYRPRGMPSIRDGKAYILGYHSNPVPIQFGGT